MRETRCAELTVGKKQSEFDKREMVCGKHEECVTQKLIGSRPEMVEAPVAPEDFRDFGDGDEVRRFLFERVESHRHDGIGWVNHDQLVAQVPVLAALARIDTPQKKRRSVTMEIEINESAVFLDVLLAHGAQKIALAAPSLPKYDDVAHALTGHERHLTTGGAAIHHAVTEIKAAPMKPCSASPADEAVPNGCDESFQDANHGFNSQRGIAVIGNTRENPGGRVDRPSEHIEKRRGASGWRNRRSVPQNGY
jgi:hypothetical protein